MGLYLLIIKEDFNILVNRILKEEVKSKRRYINKRKLNSNSQLFIILILLYNTITSKFEVEVKILSKFSKTLIEIIDDRFFNNDANITFLKDD